MDYIKSNRLTMWLIFLISPLLALFIAVRNFKYRYYHIFIILFFTLYGYSFIPIPESDVENHIQYFGKLATLSFSGLIDLISGIYSADARNPDFYMEIVGFIVSRFTTDYRVFLLVISFLYYLTLIEIGRYAYSLYKPTDKAKYFFLFFIGFMCVWKFSAGVNNIRFPMAFMVFAYGALKLVTTREKKYILLALLSIFIHFSLLYSFIFLLIYFYIGYPKKNLTLIIILLISGAFSLFIGDIIQENIGILGQGFGNKYEAYTDEYYIEQREDHLKSVNWYIQLDRFSTYYFAIIVMLLSKLKAFKLKFDTTANNLFGFAVIMLIQNLFSGVLVDSISNRYYLLFNMFGLIYLFYLGTLNTKSKFLKASARIYFFILLLHVLIMFRSDLYTVSPILLFGNFIFVFITESTISIQDLLLS